MRSLGAPHPEEMWDFNSDKDSGRRILYAVKSGMISTFPLRAPHMPAVVL